MGYYKDTGSLRSMASAEAILKKRMPEKVGILPVAELLFVAESMWVGEHDMKGHFHPSFRFVKAKRYNAKPHVLIELDGETLADINGRSKYYESFSRCVDRKPEEGAWIEPTEFGMMFLSILDLGMSEEEAEKIGIPITQINSDEYGTLAKGEIENILKRDGRSRTVVCVETGKRYESIKAASAEYGDRLGTARSGIGLCCKNPYRTFDGKHWCYPDDLESRIDNAEEYTVPRKTAVRCLETGKMYESIADASRDTGINYNSIASVARGNRHKAGGYTWEYVNPAPDKRGNRGCNQPTAKKVRCAETGNQFVSLSDAARAVGLRNGNSIRRAIDRGGTAGGYHWEYLDEKKEVSTDDHHQADRCAEFRSHEEPARLYQR